MYIGFGFKVQGPLFVMVTSNYKVYVQQLAVLVRARFNV